MYKLTIQFIKSFNNKYFYYLMLKLTIQFIKRVFKINFTILKTMLRRVIIY